MELSPKNIVSELDRYIIGQQKAKVAVAIALRNRYRRSRLPEELREEITPKNIIMKGPTGVGKTEIARRLARLVRAPFIKVEATKFTEVGYVGRDVESIIRDLAEVAIRMVREEKYKEVQPRATEAAEKVIVETLLPVRKKTLTVDMSDAEIREEILRELRAGNLNNIQVELEIKEQPKPLNINPQMDNSIDFGQVIGSVFGPPRKKRKKITVKQAMDFIISEESAKLIDNDTIIQEALRRAEQDGVVFIDEIDKVAGASGGHGPDVSREGVQRDILPIVEGSTVQTKHGPIRTDFILFIAAGAFHISNIQDLIPELQGRFPIRVELDSLSEEDFIKILTQPDNAILMQYQELLKIDGVELKFTDEAIAKIAKVAALENENSENLGARRLHAVMEQLLEDISFEASGESEREFVIDDTYVEKHLEKSLKTLNLNKYIL
ncbi:MAG: ATP-dependent protease ATPase subunit HslU [Christensenellales bacterium]|jgi:ATP-dependent HslUV protease ATP-binding subunit HslU|nr:ATP-dependent protease ATPase subunit HslU [Eubacteriales bacterium]